MDNGQQHLLLTIPTEQNNASATPHPTVAQSLQLWGKREKKMLHHRFVVNFSNVSVHTEIYKVKEPNETDESVWEFRFSVFKSWRLSQTNLIYFSTIKVITGSILADHHRRFGKLQRSSGVDFEQQI